MKHALPFGHTRSAVKTDHAFLALDSHVQAALPGWNGTPGVVLISPHMGARFCQYLAFPNAKTQCPPALEGIERFVYVLEGEIETEGKLKLQSGGFVYIGPTAPQHITATQDSRLLIFDKRYQPVAGYKPPRIHTGQENDFEGQPFLGDPDARLKLLLPDTPEFDMAINIFAFQPGAQLPFVEVHVMEHGLMMIDGGGIYNLADSWYPIQSGDCLWMASYCPQWFAATGKTPARYIYYKDINRDALTAL